MIDYDSQLRLQAYLDDELSASEKARVEGLLAREPLARNLLAELQFTKTALAGFEADVRLPESREFFWSKIRREIGRPQPREPVPNPVAFWTRFQRLLIPAGSVAALLLAGVVFLKQSGPASAPHLAAVESTVGDPGAFTYRDYARGTTLVWLSYPAEKEVALNDPASTFQ